MVNPSEFALIVAAARKEVAAALASTDREALKSFAPSFSIKDGHLFMAHAGSVADLGNIIGPRGMDGFNGIDGTNGTDGQPGANGIDGKAGENGRDGRDGRDGIDGKDGKDGVGVADAYVSDTGFLVIVLSDGKKIMAGHVRGRDGKDGKNGTRGLTSVMYGGAGSTTSTGGGSASISTSPGNQITTGPDGGLYVAPFTTVDLGTFA